MDGVDGVLTALRAGAVDTGVFRVPGGAAAMPRSTVRRLAPADLRQARFLNRIDEIIISARLENEQLHRKPMHEARRVTWDVLSGTHPG